MKNTLERTEVRNMTRVNNNTINEECKGKQERARPVSCYVTPPLAGEEIFLTNDSNSEKRNSGLFREGSWMGRTRSMLKRQIISPYNGLRELSPSSEKNHRIVIETTNGNPDQSDIGNSQMIEKKHIIPEKHSSYPVTSTTNKSCSPSPKDVKPKSFDDISSSTIDVRKSSSKQRNSNSTYTKRISSSSLPSNSPNVLKVKIYLNSNDQLEDVIALRIKKDKLQTVDQLVDVIIYKITNRQSNVEGNNIKLMILFNQANVKPITLKDDSRNGIDNSSFDLLESDSLIMDYVSGKEKLYIKAIL